MNPGIAMALALSFGGFGVYMGTIERARGRHGLAVFHFGCAVVQAIALAVMIRLVVSR